MAYQQVGTPKFFIDHGLWLKNPKSFPSEHPYNVSEDFIRTVTQLNPTNYLFFEGFVDTNGNYDSGGFSIGVDKVAPINYVAVLGHNIKSNNGHIFVSGKTHDDITYEYSPGGTGEVEIINHNARSVPDYDGFTMIEIANNDSLKSVYVNVDVNPIGPAAGTGHGNVGAVSIGSTYTMPHSPDMSLSLSYDYSGIKTIETLGGSSLSNSFYSKPPTWGSLGAWELHDPDNGDPTNQALSRSGRRIWDLSFSYLDDGDVFGSNQSLSFDTWKNAIADGTPPASAFDGTPGESGADLAADAQTFNYNLLSDDNFFSQVIHKTRGQLPFIFQPNNNDKTNFAICKFDQKSFSFQQTAPGLYSVKCKIREVW